MAVYAESSDLERRIRRTLTEAERGYVQTALEDASLQVDVECPMPPSPTEDEREHALAVRLVVVCRMVKRAFQAPGDAAGIESAQQGAGPFQVSYNFTNPAGDLYLTKADRKMLGCGGQVAFTVPMTTVEQYDPLGLLPRA